MACVDHGRRLLRESKSLNLYSGNILIKSLPASHEICFALSHVVEKWVAKQKICDMQASDALDVYDEDDIEEFEEERDELKFSLKIFLYNNNPSLVNDIIDQALQHLKCDERIDNVTVSFADCDPDSPGGIRRIKYSSIKPVWQQLERLVTSGYIDNLGVTDFDCESLKELCENTKVKPSSNSVKLLNCCIPPEDLCIYAAENDISLLTQSDSSVILPRKCLQRVLGSKSETALWNIQYIARYTTVIRCRAIVKSKGYFMKLEQDHSTVEDT